MDINKETYKKYARAHAPRSPLLKNCVKAFLVGGAICGFAEVIRQCFETYLKLETSEASALTSISLAFVAVTLTALGVFDKVARVAGAGTLVPITGFANAVASSAIDARSEGFVIGLGAKIFSVAGAVLLYGTVSGCVWGVICFALSRVG